MLFDQHSGVQDGTSSFAVVATAEGNLAVWPSFEESTGQEPLTARVTDDITCIAAVATTDKSIAALFGTESGKLYCLHCDNSRRGAVPPTLVVSELKLTEVTIFADTMRDSHAPD